MFNSTMEIFKHFLPYLMFTLWVIICLVAFYKLVTGKGMRRIHRAYVLYEIKDGMIKIKVFGIFCVRQICIKNIKQIIRFSESAKKLNMYLEAEHWEHTPFRPIIGISEKVGIKEKWILLSPENINEFIIEVEKVRGGKSNA